MSFFKKLFSKPKEPLAGSPEFNDSVRNVLLENFGDNGASVRHVVHYAYPEKDTDRNDRTTMVEALKDKGFDVRDAAADDGLVLEHHRSVTPDDFDALTAELSAWFAARHWDYDGWECAVATEENAA